MQNFVILHVYSYLVFLELYFTNLKFTFLQTILFEVLMVLDIRYILFGFTRNELLPNSGKLLYVFTFYKPLIANDIYF